MPSALFYDLFMAPLERLALPRARRRLARGVAGRVLEVGAGTGLQFKAYDGVLPAAALDVDLDSLRRARRRHSRVPLVCGDAQALPFRDGAFDAVVDSLAFCSIPDPRAALLEVRRVLRPGGELRMLEHVRPHGLLGRLFDWLTPLWSRIAGGCHLNRRTADSVREAGFEIGTLREHLRGASIRLLAKAPRTGRG